MKTALAPKEKALSKSEAAKLRDGILEDIRSVEGRMIAAAIKLDKFVRGQGWTPLGYDSLSAWRDAEIETREFYNLRNVGRLLEAGIEPEAVEKMRLTNINTMVRSLPEKAWVQPEWKAAATELPVGAFEEKARKEAQKAGTEWEYSVRRGFALPKSLADKWDMALRVAEAVDGAARMDERIEAIVSCYLDSPSEMPGKSKQQAFEAAFGDGQ